MSAKNFMSYGDAETVFTAMANAIKNNEDAVAAIKDGTDIDSFGDVEVALLDKADTSDLGTAAAKDSTNSVTAGSTDLVESGAVKDAIDAAVAAAYHHAGTKTVAQLTHDLLIAANEGNVYNITDSGTTTSDFIEGIGKTIDEGSNVGICKVGNVYMFDLLSGFVDTTNFVQKSQTSGLLNNDGTVNTTIEDDVDQVKSGLTNLDVFLFGSEILSNVDLNDYKTSASYRIGNISTCTNRPDISVAGTSGVFIVEKHKQYILQKFYGDIGYTQRFSYDGGTTWVSWDSRLTNLITSFTLTPSTNVTLDSGSCIKTKNIVIVDAVVTFTKDMAKNNSIVSGVPTIGNNNIPLHAVMMYSNGTTAVKYVRVYANAIYSSEAFTSGDTIHIMGTYTVTD